ncbi:alkaline phosphatase family protein [Acetobacter oeni]|uniref:Alkaline phosphatase family protein n=1 Tax=Acetobacter oeni TaxID=304077 RepID=A0A511XIY6_9PROT|nr:ectonucleotide pyrophosphatase/phosphodiesterase [Acetobacter oeni]MBB3882657.1 putative AlkP superfamily pyrophosphatase or phosphodiesterase [Acetobacter oeni]NHO18760.1 alkaline phosphatase family protein [Acetobacter oeni]GBR06562.1 nucleotide diphosphatase [Acetobacter oeni LMG 21952]GEN62913.1 alkaline phosphatase family protein [Acetobacter oeni]
MTKFLLTLFGMVLPVLLSACSAGQPAPVTWEGKPAVILVSLDGFRTEYLSRGLTPHLQALADGGVRARAMRPSFPSITFPNHYTLVTGLRPDHHGIVGNSMFDPVMPGVHFSMASHESWWWDEAEPIWVTAEKQGLNAGTMFWPGSESVIHGKRPDEWEKFDSHMSDDTRVDTLLSWYDRGVAQRPRLATLYFNAVDSAGHHFGPGSSEVNAALRDVDEAVGRLEAGLKARHIPADIIVVADHGMAPVGDDQVIAMDKVAPAASWRWVTGGAYAGVDALPGQQAVLETALLKPHDHMQCWRRDQIPARFHYGHNPRVPGYICLAETGWMIRRDGTKPEHEDRGEHGYDPALPDMSALFVAQGPDLKAGTVLEPFDNVDVYFLVAHLLGVKALPGDGSLDTFRPVLSDHPS